MSAKSVEGGHWMKLINLHIFRWLRGTGCHIKSIVNIKLIIFTTSFLKHPMAGNQLSRINFF